MKEQQQQQRRHGGAFDRGGADYYYMRPYEPHYYVKGTYTSERITDLTQAELDAYRDGWNEAADFGDQKEW